MRRTHAQDQHETHPCWLCGDTNLHLVATGIAAEAITPAHFAITDSDYGQTLTLYQCQSCGFRFCPDAGDVTHYYTDMEDTEYEHTRKQRALQARNLLHQLRRYKPSGTLLDIGAGSGILVEEAIQLGYRAHGIEPSTWLVQQASQKSIPVTHGVFPGDCPGNDYDIITLVDVLEHVHNPLALLQNTVRFLKPGGIAVIVTPDIASVAARVLGRKWWHYRIAHIGYFSRKTLLFALHKAGLRAAGWRRPTWFFPLSYLVLRLGHYVPGIRHLARWHALESITIPLNLYDSWLVIARRHE